jgi:DNA polymerase-3 subunit delta'
MKELYPWQNEIWQHLQEIRSRLPHALLLKGAQGIGKLDLALNFAQSLLCETPQASGMACASCASCRWFAQESHPDFRLIQPDSISGAEDSVEKEGGKKLSREISVDQIRALSAFANLSAHCGGYRVILIHPAESMNSNSANALLKSLEEPSDSLLFILVTNKPQQLLPTILSRCLSFTVPMPPRKQAISWLEEQGIAEAATKLAQTGFAPVAALTCESDAAATEERKLLLLAFRESQQFDSLALAEQLQRVAPVQIIQFLQQWCYDLVSCKLTMNVRYHPEHIETIRKISGNIALIDLLRYQGELQTAKREAFHPLNPRLLFESLFLNYRQLAMSGNKP